jgi:hypothetical protein
MRDGCLKHLLCDYSTPADNVNSGIATAPPDLRDGLEEPIKTTFFLGTTNPTFIAVA